ncbi:hypothetical protein DES52_106175 [Deinococcus yavapaiensis KR-236]|uniref:Uncharacterized protein n=1 Tax=Deinococcus yavapaiensis KR-236 TaxID=694435 RepID=A0A318SNI6_9DEIO|nr:hypothetical protein DES52_106175 [Deinococcus yavapaiensis KR-236]
MSSPPSSARFDRLRLILLIALLVSFVPALLLAWNRIQYEQSKRTVTVVMDYSALNSQATELGRDWHDLLREYRSYGVNGVAVFEDVVGDYPRRGAAIIRSGSEIVADDPSASVRPNYTYLTSVKPGVVEALRDRYTYRTEQVTWRGRTWIGWPVDIRGLPAGPDTPLISELQRDGLVLVYRPYDVSSVKLGLFATDWPNVPFIVFNGSNLVANNDPERLKTLEERLGSRVPAVIEASVADQQKGIEDVIRDRPAIRLFAIRPEWQRLLDPEETASKYVLAARERSHRLLYVRPYEREDDTKTFLTSLKAGLGRANIQVGMPQMSEYAPSAALRWLSMIGPILALVLMALSYPLSRLGVAAAALTLVGAAVVNHGAPFGTFALVAAVTFPALGLVMRRNKPTDWLLATLLSVMGALFVAALATDRLAMLGLDPFRGVGLTLVVPLLLFGLSLLPRQDIRKTATDLYNTPMRLGDIAIIMFGLAAIALVVLRRGNTPAVGVSDTEAKVRQALQDSMIRPRTKEIFGHPAGILGLTNFFPPYMSYLLLAGGVVGQSSILNTFSHSHTPLLISLLRTFNGIWVGALIGFVLIPIVSRGLQFFKGQIAERRAPKTGQRI